MNPDSLSIFLGDVVLDVGCGNSPYPYATILSDRYIEDTSHRGFNPIKMSGKPFVVADVQYLPFKDKAIDVVIANQVLEHVDNPVLACKELMRVAKRGYIECPSIWLEQGYWIASSGTSHWEKHQWYVINPDQSPYAGMRREIGRKLIFQKKDYNFKDSCIHSYMMRLMFVDVLAHFSGQNKTDNNYINRIMAGFSPNIHHVIFHFDGLFEVELRDNKGNVMEGYKP